MSTQVRIREIADPIAQNRLQKLQGHIERVINYQTLRSRFIDGETSDPRRDIDDECGYPKTSQISLDDYRGMYYRNPIAKKVVDLLPRRARSN